MYWSLILGILCFIVGIVGIVALVYGNVGCGTPFLVIGVISIMMILNPFTGGGPGRVGGPEFSSEE